MLAELKGFHRGFTTLLIVASVSLGMLSTRSYDMPSSPNESQQEQKKEDKKKEDRKKDDLGGRGSTKKTKNRKERGAAKGKKKGTAKGEGKMDK